MSAAPIIMYVEDNLENRILIRRVLMAEGYKVVEAENAQRALEVLKDLVPDLILMDVNMPEMDGLTLTAKIKSIPNLFNVPVIALTANVMKGDRERTLEAGSDGYLQKPVDIDALPHQVEKFLALGRTMGGSE